MGKKYRLSEKLDSAWQQHVREKEERATTAHIEEEARARQLQADVEVTDRFDFDDAESDSTLDDWGEPAAETVFTKMVQEDLALLSGACKDG